MNAAETYLHHNTPFGPLYVLTNQGCENTDYWNTEQFKQLGLTYEEIENQDGLYPLVEEEYRYLDATPFNTPAGGDFMMGYSALYQGKKWAMLSIEYLFPDKTDAGDAEFVAMVDETLCLKRLLELDHQHTITLHDGPDDRLTVVFLVSFAWLGEHFNGLQDWRRFLERGLGVVREKEHEPEQEQEVW